MFRYEVLIMKKDGSLKTIIEARNVIEAKQVAQAQYPNAEIMSVIEVK